jgi:transitional endoplasmic reticulum ATPase
MVMLQSPIAGRKLPALLPTQVETCTRLKMAVEASPYVVFADNPGMGRTVLLRHFAQDIGAKFIDIEAVAEAFKGNRADAPQEILYELVTSALNDYGTVICDDFFTSFRLDVSRGGWSRRLWSMLIPALRDTVLASDRRLVIAGNRFDKWETPSLQYGEAVVLIEAEALQEADYAAFLGRAWGSLAAEVDFSALYRAAPALDLYQLDLLANLLRREACLTTDSVLACFEANIASSNLRIGEVEALTFDSLPGVEAIGQALESHIILPFQNRELAETLGIKARRGVLLYGPPGTGKTSIGRALAHRMQGRFFLIDGTFVTEPPGTFFGMLDKVVREAKANAPSVLFIDDADVLFQIEHIAGLSRYLLSLLDGLESDTANNVCVVLTAMDAQKIPEALLRSGRIELWLEIKAPDQANRAKIIKHWMDVEHLGLGTVNYEQIARETTGFTPADLRRLAGDARLLYAADMVAGQSAQSINAYLLAAIADLVATRTVMAERLADDALRLRAYA